MTKDKPSENPFKIAKNLNYLCDITLKIYSLQKPWNG